MAQATQIYSREFDRVFMALPPDLRQRIEQALDDLGGRLDAYPHVRLQGRPEFRLRIGDYRLVYQFDIPKNQLYLIALGHRREVYR